MQSSADEMPTSGGEPARDGPPTPPPPGPPTSPPTPPPPGSAGHLGGGAPAGPAGRPRSGWWFVLRWLITLLAIVLPSAVWAVSTATATASLGPHVARYEVTLDEAVTLDLGPLGTIVVDSPLPSVLGVRAVVKEIPREVTAVEESSTLTAIGADLEGYIQFFSGPEATLEVVARALVVDAARRALLAVVLIGLTVWAVRVGLGSTRRAELAAGLKAHAPVVALTTVVGVVVGLGVTSSGPLRAEREVEAPASTVFDGTPLEGARITGRLAGVIDTYGGYVVDVYRENEDFYDRAVDGLTVAWEERAASDVEMQALRDAQLLIRATASPDDDEPTAAEDDEGEGGDRESEEEEEEPSPDLVTALVVSDLHCNVGMARVIEEAAELSGAQVVLNAGDTTINGTGVESYCISAVVGAVPDRATMVVADGNHDSEQTSAQERSAGARVLDGEVIEVDGIRILGDSDPRATRIGEGTTLVGQETVADRARALAEVACDDEAGVDLLLVHNPNVGNRALDEGCVPAQISGHLHRRVGPVAYGEGVRFVSSSTAGAALGQATVGPLNGIAELTVLRFDRTTRRFVDYRLIRLHPDGTVTVGFAVRWPGAARPPAPSDGPR